MQFTFGRLTVVFGILRDIPVVRLSEPSRHIHFKSSSNFMGTCCSFDNKIAMTSHPVPKCHYKCCNTDYPRGGPKRYHLEEKEIPWSSHCNGYDPPEFTSPSILSGPPYADKPVVNGKAPALNWNTIDGKINRKSHMGDYRIDKDSGLPLNIVGRTGVVGRGHLGRWGPNHAADPIVSRWKRNQDGEIIRHSKTDQPILQFVAIQRLDNGEWAIPGGMVDAGENVSVTLKREFSEEAMNALEASKEEFKKLSQAVDRLFKCGGTEVYRGYVDDPRNTDNAWMETVAMNFHDETGLAVGKFKLHAGDDAGKVKWMDISADVKLYASHVEFIEAVVKKLNAHW